MVTSLRIMGNEPFLPIDSEMCAALGIDEQTPLEVKIEDGRLTVSPAKGNPTFDEASEESLRENAELYRRLA